MNLYGLPLDKLWPLVPKYLTQLQHYSPVLMIYRILQTGFGFARTQDPGNWQGLKQEVEAAEAKEKAGGNCRDVVRLRILLWQNLLTTGENDGLMVETLEVRVYLLFVWLLAGGRIYRV